jgi:menaquinone-9 beta-reductase
VINASGRWSNLSRDSSKATTHPRWIGLKAHFASCDPVTTVDLYFFEGGYCGVQPVTVNGCDQAAVNVCAMVRAERATTLEQVFGLSSQLYENSRGWQQCTQLVTTSPLIFRTPTPLRGFIPQVGDAAAFVDPFIGDGISLALLSGAMAADTLKSHFDNGRSLAAACNLYKERYQREFAPVYRNSSLLRRAVNLPRLIRSPLAVLMSNPRVAGYVVRKSRRTA